MYTALKFAYTCNAGVREESPVWQNGPMELLQKSETCPLLNAPHPRIVCSRFVDSDISLLMKRDHLSNALAAARSSIRITTLLPMCSSCRCSVACLRQESHARAVDLRRTQWALQPIKITIFHLGPMQNHRTSLA